MSKKQRECLKENFQSFLTAILPWAAQIHWNTICVAWLKSGYENTDSYCVTPVPSCKCRSSVSSNQQPRSCCFTCSVLPTYINNTEKAFRQNTTPDHKNPPSQLIHRNRKKFPPGPSKDSSTGTLLTHVASLWNYISAIPGLLIKH